MNQNRYDQLGVSASKTEVHQAIKGLDKGLYPGAFCKVLAHISRAKSELCSVIHADTAGTKTVLAYMLWKETGDLSVWEDLAQDAMVMNLDDLACIGLVDQILVSSTIGRNKHLIPSEVLKSIIHGNQKLIDTLSQFGINVHYGGGETADVGDVVRTIDVGITAYGEIEKQKLIIPRIQPGDVIVGLASFGQASYEQKYNSGIGSNGLTAARHDLLAKEYANRFPESVSPETSKDAIYNGRFHFSDIVGNYNIGQWLLSPTRTYLPVIKKILDEVDRQKISALIHCTGGGQTKVKKFAHGVKIIKDNLFESPVFELLASETNYEKKELYEIFNMGHRMELYCKPELANDIISFANEFSIDARIIGYVEANAHEHCSISIKSKYGSFLYD